MNTSDFGAHWRARLTELRDFRSEKGATDPILIIAGIAITLILLVGGTFAVAGFMNNARNLNAKGDIDRLAVAMEARRATDQLDDHAPGGIHYAAGEQLTYFAEEGLGYLGYPTPDPEMPQIEFTLSEGTQALVIAVPNGKTNSKGNEADWGAFVRSSTGNWYFRSQTSTTIWDFGILPGDGSTVVPPEGFMDTDSVPDNMKSQIVAIFSFMNSGVLDFE